mmetsp:Transcript_33684/g.38784  ORF Transcript_33684/g.38784 Transcript_33684/m.38784 type:complete len:211 (-) Transcript_33684:416-1048(-)
MHEVKVLLELLVAQLVAVFILSVANRVLLNRVVRQMDVLIRYVLERELLAGRANIPVSVPVPAQVPVDRRYQRVAPDVKLALVNQQRVLDVFLDDVAPALSIFGLYIAVDQVDDLLISITHVDSVPSVRVLTRLDNPNVLHFLLVVSAEFFVGLAEYFKLGVARAFLNVVRQRDEVKGVLPQALIISLHVVIQRLLVRQVDVPFEMVAHL